MRKLTLSILFLFVITNFAFAQANNSPEANLWGGIGAAFIENEQGEMEMWYNITAQPEIRFGKLGMGLNINFLYNPNPSAGDDKIRAEDLKPEKIIKYVSWGYKGDKPIYIKVGALTHAMLGHGFLLYQYNNQINENNPKLGLALDINLKKYGIETLTNDLGRMSVFGVRPYTKPLKITNTQVPILSNLEVGASYVVDVDPDEDKDTKDDQVYGIGLDVGLPIVENALFNWNVYYDWAKLNAKISRNDTTLTVGGNGSAVGTNFQFKGLGLVTIGIKVERRFLGKEFMPSYFNAFYEVDKMPGRVLDQDPGEMLLTGKAYTLQGVDEELKGTFGELSGNILQKVTLLGHYQYMDDQKNSGVLHLEADGGKLLPEKLALLNATYDKEQVDKLSEVFSIDENSIAAVNVGYNINKFTLLTIKYEWAFRWDEAQEHLETIEKIIPGVQFNYNF